MPKISQGRRTETSSAVVPRTRMPRLDDFVDALRETHRQGMKLFISPHISVVWVDRIDARTLLEDVGLLLEVGPVVGIRNIWIRKVAQPILMTHKALQGRNANRFAIAREIMLQCIDPELRGVILGEIDAAEVAANKPDQPERPGIVQAVMGLFTR